jgi:hypothetical protein
MPSKREPSGAVFEARRRRFAALAGSCPDLPDVPAHAAAAEGRRSLLNAEGGCVGVSKACWLFRKPRPVTRRTLIAQIRKGAVVAYHRGGGHYAVPVWQFRSGGAVIDGLPEVLRALRSRVPGFGQISPFAFFLQADPVTDGRTPLAVLRDGETFKVLDAVKARIR